MTAVKTPLEDQIEEETRVRENLERKLKEANKEISKLKQQVERLQFGDICMHEMD